MLAEQLFVGTLEDVRIDVAGSDDGWVRKTISAAGRLKSIPGAKLCSHSGGGGVATPKKQLEPRTYLKFADQQCLPMEKRHFL